MPGNKPDKWDSLSLLSVCQGNNQVIIFFGLVQAVKRNSPRIMIIWQQWKHTPQVGRVNCSSQPKWSRTHNIRNRSRSGIVTNEAGKWMAKSNTRSIPGDPLGVSNFACPRSVLCRISSCLTNLESSPMLGRPVTKLQFPVIMGFSQILCGRGQYIH